MLDNTLFLLFLFTIVALAVFLTGYGFLKRRKNTETPSKHPPQESSLKPTNTRQNARIRYLLDKLPSPAWIRDAETLDISYCNAAYATALDCTPREAVDDALELAGTTLGKDGKRLARQALSLEAAQSESQSVVIKGRRRLLEFTELPMVDNSALVGFANDYTAIETLQSDLERHVSAHHDVLEYMTSGIAIYGADQRLAFYNAAFTELWKIDEEYLSKEPTFSNVLEELRAKRRIPEQADFPTFKQEQAAQFQRLLEPKQELLHLPDERTIKVMTIPHPMGGLMLVYENVTDRLAMERQYSLERNIKNTILDELDEAVLIIGSDNRLQFANAAAIARWSVQLDALAAEETPMVDVLEKAKKSLNHGTIAWEKYKGSLLNALQRRSLRQGNFNKNTRYRLVPLPHGGMMLGVRDRRQED